ncbi:trigger factor [bacterium]|nr:MAG: trigger factor [bacterium]
MCARSLPRIQEIVALSQGGSVARVSATLKQIDPTRVELEIEIPKEMLEAAEDRAFRRLVKGARIPGFRPGHIPRRIFEQHYGHGEIHDRAMEDVVPSAYTMALKEHDLDPVDRPQMELVPTEGGDGEGNLRLKATVFVRPPITLGEYKGVELGASETVVDEAEVDRTLEALRRQVAEVAPVERPVQLGDIVTADFLGKVDGVAFEGGSGEGQTLEIDVDRFVPGFAEGFVGMTAGESKDIQATFPESYGKEDLAGKTAIFSVTVHEVKEPRLPELNDAFAESVSNNATLDALKDDVRNRLRSVAEAKAKKELSAKLLERLVTAHDFPLPTVMVDGEIESLLEDTKSYVRQTGQTWDEYLKEHGKSEDELRDEVRKEAQTRVKTTLLIEAIAKAENVEVTTAEVDAEIRHLAEQYGQPKERILEMLRHNVSALIDGIRRSKTIELLLEHAKVTPEQAATG